MNEILFCKDFLVSLSSGDINRVQVRMAIWLLTFISFAHYECKSNIELLEYVENFLE